MDNSDVAAVLYEIADLLELQGVAFKPQAYRRAARNIEQLDRPLSEVVAEGKLDEVPGVGEALSKKVQELLSTGELPYLDKLRSEVPEGLVRMLEVPDVGPKTAMLLHQELGVSSVEELKAAALAHRLRGVKGLGEKTEERILQGIKVLESKGGRMLLGEALPMAEEYVEYLKSSQRVDRISVAGSLRRGRDTIGDIDILVGDDDPGAVIDAFAAYPAVEAVLVKGPTKCSVRLDGGTQVDLRAVETKSYGAALQYFTGSKEHNVALRRIGVEMGLKLNEYGLFERDSGRMVAGATEEEVYSALGLAYIPPEIRENSGEVEAARQGRVPELVRLDQVKGDLHVHTDWSDGSDPVGKVLSEATRRGYEYVAITDHSQSLKIANGLTPERLRRQVDAVRKAEDLAGGVVALAGSEVDILPDGSLDMPSDVLNDLDIVIGSVHSRFKMDRAEMTKRVVAAISSGRIDVLGHPTGRLIGQRGPYELDLPTVLGAAAEHGVCVEVNCFPDRLDLRDADCRAAGARGVRVSLGTDSHRVEHMGFIRLGVITARRGWLGPGDVLNTLGASELAKHLRGRRR
ncbi:MAG: polymerase [Candidatus Thermoplasmatota archaeon]|nr:polymerase [Candidatus Thermoplasmatota archaeon]